jgi:hypothetical protein
MGIGAALVVVLVAAVIGVALILDARHVDTEDAGHAADRWAQAHARAGESFERESCSASFEGERESEFGCIVRYPATHRRYVIYLRAVDDYTKAQIVRAVPFGANESVTLAPIPERYSR